MTKLPWEEAASRVMWERVEADVMRRWRRRVLFRRTMRGVRAIALPIAICVIALACLVALDIASVHTLPPVDMGPPQ